MKKRFLIVFLFVFVVVIGIIRGVQYLAQCYAKNLMISAMWRGNFATPMIFSEDGTYAIMESAVFGNKWSPNYPAITLSGKWKLKSASVYQSAITNAIIEGDITHSLFSDDFAVGKKWIGRVRCETYNNIRAPGSSASKRDEIRYQIIGIYAENATSPFLTFEKSAD